MNEISGDVELIEPATVLSADSAPADTAKLRAERLRRFKLAIFSSLLIRPLSVIIPLLTIPLFLKYLGKERYGLYEAVGALAAWLAATNLGLTMGLLNRLVDCHVSGDRALARRYTSTLTLFLAGLLLALLLIFSVVVVFVNWTPVFGVEGDLAKHEAPWAFWIAGVAVLTGLLVSLPNTIYAAEQEQYRANAWEGAGKLVTLGACVVVIFTPFGTPGVVLASAAVAGLVRLVNLFTLFSWEKPWLRPSLRLFDMGLLRSLFSDSILIFALQIACGLLFQMDKTLISVILGSEQVTSYAILGRGYIVCYGMFMLVLTPLWPAVGESLRRGDLAWVKRTLKYSSFLGCGIMLGVAATMLFAGEWVFSLLSRATNETVHVSTSLILALGTTYFLRAWVDCRSIILLSANVIKPQLIFYCGHAVLNVIVAIPAAYAFGVEGVAWSTSITMLMTSVWGYPYMLRRYIFVREEKDREWMKTH